MERFTLVLVSILCFIGGIFTMIEQKMPTGKYGGWQEVGDIAYLFGSIFIIMSFYIIYYLVYSQKKRNKK